LKSLHPAVLIGSICPRRRYTPRGAIRAGPGYAAKNTETDHRDIYPLTLHGDGFFDLLDDWLITSTSARDAPRRKDRETKLCDSVIRIRLLHLYRRAALFRHGGKTEKQHFGGINMESIMEYLPFLIP
jgi:hypothetical protein